MIRSSVTIAGLLLSTAATAQTPSFVTQNSQAAPIQGCRQLAGQNKPSGFYWTSFDASTQVQMFCDNDIEFNGLKGGWTLVWSNLRGGVGKLTTRMPWATSIDTLPIYKGAQVGSAVSDRQAFEVFTGLKWWRAIANPASGGRGEIAYEWAYVKSPDRAIDRLAACRFYLNPLDEWAITFNAEPCKPIIGTELPGLFTYHNGKRWTTVDHDVDDRVASPVNCASLYTDTPWWYGDCWNGSISGGGEGEGGRHKNGAYWRSSDAWWGRADGTGAGNGWIYIR